MPRNGSGAYSLPEAAFVFDTVISETEMNSNLSDIASALTASIAKDGQTTLTANLPMAGFKHTGLGVGSAEADSVTLRQVQASAYCFVASDTGSADAYAIAPSPSIAAYAAGQKFSFPAANASTGASTLAVSALATKAIEYQGAALTGAEIKAGATIYVEYDGTAFQMISPSNLLSAATGTMSDLSDDTTPQLGGNLDVNGKDIVSAGDGDIDIVPDGTGKVNLQDKPLQRANLLDYGEVTNALGDLGGGTDDIDLTLGNVITALVSTGTETFTFSNPTASDEGCGFTLVLTNGGSQTVNWPGSVDWAGGNAPSLTAAGIDVLCFFTVTGGTTWYGFAASLDNS